MESAAEPTDPKQLSREQFGANAVNYASSRVHARGASLDRMAELIDPDPSWVVLDIATAAGHTGLRLAPQVASLVASDLTAEMVRLTRQRASDAGHANVEVAQADAEHLPFRTTGFDLVTCRIAPHHFPRPRAFVTEVARVLHPGGSFVMVDNTVPSDPAAARWYNDWERRRDPSHVRCLSETEWLDHLGEAGLEVRHVETTAKLMRFAEWTENMSAPHDLRARLLADLLAAPPAVKAFLTPGGTDDETATFRLAELLVVADKPAA